MENEIMNNEEVIETTEEIVKATSNGGMKTAAIVGGSMILGGLAYKFVVAPTVAKVKNWREKRKAAKYQDVDDVCEFRKTMDDDNSDSE